MRFQIWLKEMFSDSIGLLFMGNYGKSAPVQVWTVFGTGKQVGSRRVLLNRSFQAFKSTHFSDSIISEIFKLCTWCFFWKCDKFCVDSKNSIKIKENVSHFWVNGLWRCWDKFSQLWREYMWSAVNVLTSTTEISDLTERDVF